MTKRVSFYVDGFNLYFSLLECAKRDSSRRSFKWFDLDRFLRGFLRKDRSEQLEEINYFSAYFPWDTSQQPFRDDPSKEARHKIYRKVLEAYGIHTEFGYFMKKKIYGPHSGLFFDAPEEKQTDVNIAVSIVRDAALNKFDTGILVSGDTDFLPVFDAVRAIDKTKKIGVLFPFMRKNTQMKNVADFQIKSKFADYEQCILPDPVILEDGTKLFCPVNWK